MLSFLFPRRITNIKKRLQLTHYLIATVIILILITISLVIAKLHLPDSSISQNNYSTVNNNTLEISRERNFWLTRIKDTGGENAYREFKKKYNNSPKDIHYIAHIFGEALYQQEGIKSMIVCDASFAYGCYHGLIVTTLSDHGLETLPQLNEICVQNNKEDETGCRHGIGHGLLEYLGGNQLQKALELCSSIQPVSLLGCTQGVFMEYNRPGMMDHSNKFFGTRLLKDETKIMEPCSYLPKTFKNSCYYELSQWWVSILNQDIKKIGLLCNELETEDNKKSCYMGVGTIVSQRTLFDIPKTINACSLLPNNIAETYCRATAAWVFYANPNPHREQYHKLCEGLDNQNYQLCIKNSIEPSKVIKS
jgi:hypothetical protein